MDDEVQRAVHGAPALLSAAESVLGDDESYSRTEGGADLLDEHLSAAIRALSGGSRRRAADTAVGNPDAAPATAPDADADAARERAVLLELRIVRSALRGNAAARMAPVASLSALLRALRSFSSLSDMLDRAPGEIHRIGFGRVMLSRVQGSLWIPRSGSVAGNPGLAGELLRMGAEYPGTLNGSMVEAEVVRRVKPILVRDARGNTRVHHRLRDLIDCRAYVSAPLVVNGAVVGLIHADRDPGSETVDSFDRDLLGLVAEGLGFAVERVVFLERLQALRHQLDEHTSTVSSLIGEFLTGEVELSGRGRPDLTRRVPRSRELAWDDPRGEPSSGLTPREADVLRHMALGETNAQIAHRLFVSEGTVKSHVKHILRKLDAANRAEAVSRYHLMKREPAYSPRGR